MNKFPYVAIIGHVSNIEKDRLGNRVGNQVTLYYYDNDDNISQKIARDKINVIITIGKSDADFPQCYNLSYYYRSKWLHFSDIGLLEAYHIFNCYLTDNRRADIPLVSVCTTSYKSGEKILRPYHSLMNQIYKNWEWVIFDDSPKGNPNFELLTWLTTQDPRIRLYRGIDNCGIIGDVKYNVFGLAHGEILVELDHDDELTPDCLQLIVDAFVQFPDADFAYTDFAELYEETHALFRYCEGYCFGFGGYYTQRHNDFLVNVARAANINPKTIRNIVGVPNHVRAWKKSFYHKIGGYNYLLPVSDDYELLVRTFLNGKMVKIPFLGYLQYRNKDGNTTFTRNDEITKLQNRISIFYEDQISKRMTELGIDDNQKNAPYKYIWDAEPLEIEKYYNYVYLGNHVAVIITCYNNPHGLKRAINSVLEQSYENFRIHIIGDNCAVLKTVIKQYQDSRITWWNLDSHYNDHRATCRNYALKLMANGKYIAYLNDTDVWQKDYLQLAVTELNSGVAYCFSGYRIYHKNDKYLKNPLDIMVSGPTKNQIVPSSVVHRFDLVERYGYWSQIAESIDIYDCGWDFFSRWTNEKYTILNQILVDYTVTSPDADISQIGQDTSLSISESAKYVDKHYMTTSVKFNVYALNWNEGKLLPAFLHHYRQAHRIVVYDNQSSDNSVSIIQDAGREVVSFDTNNTFDDITNMKLKNTIWKDSLKDNVDYVIVQDLDEFIHFPKYPGNLLAGFKNLKEKGITCTYCKPYNMICTEEQWHNSIDLVKKWNMDISSIVNKGFHFPEYSKPNIFNPKQIHITNYSPGSHGWMPVGNVIYANDDDLPLMLHYKYIGKNYCIDLCKNRRSRLSETNKIYGFGYHYNIDDGKIVDNINNIYNNIDQAVEVTPKYRVKFIIGVNYSLEFLKECVDDPTLHVFAFEPDPKIVNDLKSKNLPSNYHLIQKAVSDKAGKAIFNVCSNNTCSSLHNWGNGPRFGSMSQIEVECIRMDDFINENNFDKIEYVLIDTQGHDLNVLNSFGEKIKIVQKGVCESLAPHTKFKLYENQPTYQDMIDFFDKYQFSHSYEYNIGAGISNDEVNITFEKITAS